MGKALGSRIEPGVLTSESLRSKEKLESFLLKVFRRQKQRATDTAGQFLKFARVSKLLKATQPTPAEMASAIFAALQREFETVPAMAESLLSVSMRSGSGNGLLQLGLSDTGLIDALNATAEEYARDRAAELVGMARNEEGLLVDNPDAEWAISDTTRNKIRDIVAEAFTQETDLSDIVENVQQALEEDSAGIFSEHRAEMIARTEVSRAQTIGNYDAWKQSGLVETIRWSLSADHEGEDECDDNDGAEVGFGKPFPSGDFMPPLHPNCISGNATVSAAGVSAEMKRWFEGEVIKIRVAGVDDLTITPNHPVLTGRGWVRAGELIKGDNLFYCADQRLVVALMDPHDHLMPTLFSDVASTLLKSGRMSSRLMPVSPEDFHGDGSDGEVNIVLTDLLLSGERDTEQPREAPLGGAHGAGILLSNNSPVDQFPGTSLLSADGSVSGLDDSLSLCGTHPAVHEDPCGVMVANRQTDSSETASENAASTSHSLSEVHACLPRFVFSVKLTEDPVREPWSGHVYNLQTRDGFYFANGLIVHNCECTLVVTKVAENENDE